MHFTEYDLRLAAYAAITDDHGRLLVSWFNGSNAGWTMPGGGVEFDESIEQAVVREVFEETGYEVEVGPLLLTHHFTGVGKTNPGRPYKSQRLVFHATIVGGSLGTTEVDGTTDRAEWMTIDALNQTEVADIVRLSIEALAAESATPTA